MTEMTGLSHSEALDALKIYGKNSIEEPSKNLLLDTILGELKNPIVLLLLLASGVSFALGEFAEGVAIGVVVVLNICFTLFQAYKADNAIEALKKLISQSCIVIRGGKKINIDTSLLVPGDIVYLEAGTRVPADIEILKSTYCEVNESILTGESLPVEKKVSDGASGILYMGTAIVLGQVYGKVIKTGSQTSFGTITGAMYALDDSETLLQKKLKNLTKKLGIVGIVGAMVVFVLSFIIDKNLGESFLLTISLAVAVVPEGLPAVMTAILSIGVGAMAKKGVIMRRLDSVEGLGDITVLATDKTGTLTQNIMSVQEIWENKSAKHKISFDDVLGLSFILNTSVTELPEVGGGYLYVGDPTEIALREYMDRKNISAKSVEEKWKVTDEVPFSSETRSRSVTAELDGHSYTCINGAPEEIIKLCPQISEEEKTIILKELQEKASLGLRTIAFAYRESEGENKFAGFVSLRDPLRDGIKETIEKARQMGIRTIMITGDNPLTAEGIGIEAGIITKRDAYVSGDMLDKMDDEELAEILKKVSIFARISPIQKLRLVQVLQKSGEIVAVTGDGVNDAPALKQADIGVAMGKIGTDVAKQAADVVVTDDNYVTLIDGIYEGRAIVRRITLATTFFVGGNLGEFGYILLSLVFGLPVMSPLQILFINIITDAVPALALSFSPVKPGAKLNIKKKSLLAKAEYIHIAIAASVLSFSATAATWYFRGDEYVARTIGFLMIILIQQTILIDIWLGFIEKSKDLKALLKRSMLGAFATTVTILLVTLNSQLADLFKLSDITPAMILSIVCGISLYLVYVLIRITRVRLAK